MPAIVQVNVFETQAPTPATLQQNGALISQGATVLNQGEYALLTQPSDLTPLLAPPATVTGLVWASHVVTATTYLAHGIAVGKQIWLTILGATPAAYNGTFLCTITGTSTFTYNLYANPGSETIPGSWQPASTNELTQMVNTFFGQGYNTVVYVLELGTGDAADGVATLGAYLTANPNSSYVAGAQGYFYVYLVPRSWDADPSYLNLLASYESTTARTYFFTTTTLATYAVYTAQMKDVVSLIEAPAMGVWPTNALTAISFSGAWGANVLTALTWSAGIATATTNTAHGVVPGDLFSISGCTPAGYNGTFIALSGTNGSTLLYALTVDPGAESVLGTLVAAAGGTMSATTNAAHGVLPGQWFEISGCLPAAYNGWRQALQGTTGSTLLTNMAANPGAETQLGFLVGSQVSSAGLPSTEFSLAGALHVLLHYAPSTVNKITPFNYSFLYGVTPFPVRNNNALLTTLQNAFVNVVGTGAEGGISNTILWGGRAMDGNQFNYWYSIDWIQITADLNVANYVINWSNNPANPLYLNQDGINRLQGVVASTVAQGVSYGLVVFPPVQTALDGTALVDAINNNLYPQSSLVNAVPFVAYYGPNENPSDYKLGKYGGLTVSYVPQLGFDQITINVNVSQLVG